MFGLQALQLVQNVIDTCENRISMLFVVRVWTQLSLTISAMEQNGEMSSKLLSEIAVSAESIISPAESSLTLKTAQLEGRSPLGRFPLPLFARRSSACARMESVAMLLLSTTTYFPPAFVPLSQASSEATNEACTELC